jgi:hypothetical protein
MKNFVDYTSRKCFASARVLPSPRLRNITHTRKNIIFWTCDPNNYSDNNNHYKYYIFWGFIRINLFNLFSENLNLLRHLFLRRL